MDYFTLLGDANAEFIEKKSQFIGFVTHCDTETKAIDFIEKIRSSHRKATHNVYAYILRDNNISRYSDDGEPQGTAGVPVLEVLKKNNLTDICCVVTRYFGGIMLGGGGLVRAYSHSAKIAIDAAETVFMRESCLYNIICNYNEYGKIKHFLSSQSESYRILNESFSENIEIELITPIENNFISKIIDITNAKVTIDKIKTAYYDYLN